MIFGHETARPFALTTDTEHAAVVEITGAVPSQHKPHGANRLFAGAPMQDVDFAAQIALSAELLYHEGSGRQRDAPVRYMGQRMPNTLDLYPPWWLTGGEFATLVAATYLVAIQTPRPSPNAMPPVYGPDYSAVRTARTFGALFMRAVPEALFTAPSRKKFVDGYNSPQTKYSQLAVQGARRLLQATHDEFRAAAPQQDPHQHMIGQSVSAAMLAFNRYRMENPLLAELAGQPS